MYLDLLRVYSPFWGMYPPYLGRRPRTALIAVSRVPRTAPFAVSRVPRTVRGAVQDRRKPRIVLVAISMSKHHMGPWDLWEPLDLWDH